MEIILEWGACEQETVLRLELPQRLCKHAFVVFDSLSLVYDHEVVVDFTENFLFSENHLVGREKNVKISSVKLGHFDVFSVLDVAVEHEHSGPGKPLVELSVPFIYGNFRRNNYMVVVTRRLKVLSSHLLHLRQSRYRLDRLPKPHLVGENPIQPSLVEPEKPVETLKLVASQGAPFQKRGLSRNPHKF